MTNSYRRFLTLFHRQHAGDNGQAEDCRAFGTEENNVAKPVDKQAEGYPQQQRIAIRLK
ncbi:hypothetical protein D3C76_1819080 [compost metagenome]